MEAHRPQNLHLSLRYFCSALGHRPIWSLWASYSSLATDSSSETSYQESGKSCETFDTQTRWIFLPKMRNIFDHLSWHHRSRSVLFQGAYSAEGAKTSCFCIRYHSNIGCHRCLISMAPRSGSRGSSSRHILKAPGRVSMTKFDNSLSVELIARISELEGILDHTESE